jgi:hypothetical protein
MKRLGDPSFFYFFDRMVSGNDPDFRLDRWTLDGVTWTREKHSYAGQTHSFMNEVFSGVCSGRDGWSLLVVKEHWWKGGQEKSQRWALLTAGRRADAMAWLKKHEKTYK